MTNLRQFASIDGSKRMDGVIKDDAIQTGEQLEKCLCIHAEASYIGEFKGVSGFNSISQENLDLL